MLWTKEKIEERVIRYQNLIPCKNAFVDTRTPGSNQKENFTLIGPGVSENPNQHIHIPLPHGFNIGGARQPAGCLNSQHSHLTAEVFVVHKGLWKMIFGVNADEGSVELHPGDTISIPNNMFRGFENIGDEVGFLFAVLGRDNPGKVTWSPQVFEMAKKYGLILLKGGRLIDTTIGEKVPQGAELETPPSYEELKHLATPELEKLERCVARYDRLKPNSRSPIAVDGVLEYGVITPFKTEDGFENDGIVPWWEHGFNLRKVSIEVGRKTRWHARMEEEVIFVHQGKLTFSWQDRDRQESITLDQGDTITIPKELTRLFCNQTSQVIDCFIVRGGDRPSLPVFR